MKQFFFFIFILALSVSNAQTLNIVHKNSPPTSGVHLQFNDNDTSPLINIFQWEGANFYGCPIISDDDGNPLGWFNARNLYDGLNRVAINGDGLEVGPTIPWLVDAYELADDHGFFIKNNAVFIPVSDSLYYLFYCTAEIVDHDSFKIEIYDEGYKLISYSDGLYYSEVRLRSDSRLEIPNGKKNIKISERLYRTSQLSACLHADNLGWWLIVPKVESPYAEIFSIRDNEIKFIGETLQSDSNQKVFTTTIAKFNPIGSKMARITYRWTTDFLDQILEIFDFDRCTGQMIKTDDLRFKLPDLNFNITSDIEFSKNGQYLYWAISQHILQFDIDDINGPRDTIATYDPTDTYFSNIVNFSQLTRLPNDKILVGSTTYTPFFHLIHDPNEKGGACGFEYKAIQMPADPLSQAGRGVPVGPIPYYPQYDMLEKEEKCEVGVEEGGQIVRPGLYPNPTSDYINLRHLPKDLPYSIVGQDGRIYKHGKVDLERIDVSFLSPGIYNVVFNANVKSKRFIKL